MYIVELALRKPHTFIVLAICIVMFGGLSIARMPIDIFPTIDIPIVSCVWTYTGMSPFEMENLCTFITERSLTSTINGIDHIESVSLSGMSIVKTYLRQGTPMGEAVAMVTSVGNAILRQLPRNISPPFVTASSATDVPVVQLGISSDTMTESQLFDIANNFVRPQLATIQGTTTPFPYGGKFRQVMIDLNADALVAHGLSAYEVIQAIKNQNVIAPDGTAKMGEYEYIIVLNNMFKKIDELNDVPVKTINGAVVFVRDVAQVHDGFQPQLNIVNQNGKRAVLFNILKNGKASTLTVVSRIKAALPRIRSIVPAACKIEVITDQSLFVEDCVNDVVHEALIAAGLTALMMLALLGSWRSTVIVATSIPLAILASIIGLNLFGQTINSMTLGGLALAVGMLVDDATVAIENLHVNLDMGKDIVTAILDGAEQVAVPALVSTLSICIVFVPLLFLTEPSRSLFVPLGMAVVFAMMASYGLSRTLVPLMSKTLLASEAQAPGSAVPGGAGVPPASGGDEWVELRKGGGPPTAESTRTDSLGRAGSPRSNIFHAIHEIIESTFEGARTSYQSVLSHCLNRPQTTVFVFLAFYALSLFLLPVIGKDYFPTIDSGQLRLHVLAPPGTRVEETERVFKRIEKSIKKDDLFGAEVEAMLDNIGLPVSPINYAYSDSQTFSEADGEILITLKDRRAHPTSWYEKQIRKLVANDYPECRFYFQPADIVTQILCAGLPAPIDIKFLSYNRAFTYALAQKIQRAVKKIPGAVDVTIKQVVDAPQLKWTVDRARADQVGITQKDISNSFAVSTSSSFQLFPTFWVNNKNGVEYNLAAQTPQRDLASTDDVRVMAITPSSSTATFPQPQMLTNLAQFERLKTPAIANHMNVQPEYDIYVACQDRDLGGISDDVEKILGDLDELNQSVQLKKVLIPLAQKLGQKAELDKIFPESQERKDMLGHGAHVIMTGQVLNMRLAYIALIGGLVFALLLVYLLLVVNFQSWSDPLIILLAIPGAFSGILWSLFATQTNFSIPALMGTIMTVGVASANSILMVTFANGELAAGKDAVAAALNAGYQRFRPVIMTATAMIIGMIPMAIGGGAGGSQNAPIGRAVIGGLTVATISTLIFVPTMFSLIRGKWSRHRN